MQGQPAALPALPVQYADFAQWQRGWLHGAVLEAEVGYWRQRLADLPLLALPTDRPRPAVQTFAGAVLAQPVPAQLSEALQGVEPDCRRDPVYDAAGGLSGAAGALYGPDRYRGRLADRQPESA